MDPPSEIPEDLLVEILRRLPAKAIVRFRCVSKSWNSLLAGRAFIGAHLNRARAASRLGFASSVILSRYGDSLLAIDPQLAGPQIAVELDFPMLPYFPYYVKGHCDGMICCVVNDGSHGFLLLYNPSINVYRKMPIPPNFRSTREVFGIGFDESTDDYKIVRLPSMYCKLKVPGFMPKIEVFSLRANSWRRLPDEDTPPYFIEHVFQATNANCGIYWLAEEGDTLRCVILRFDLATEKFSVVPTPRDEADRNVSWIGMLRDELCMVHTQRLSTVDVWATGDDRNWRKVISVPRSQGPGPSVYSSRYTPLCFTATGELVMTIGGEGFVGFDPESKSFRNLEVYGAEHYLQETVICESLVSPYMGKRKELVDDEGWLANTTSNSGIKQLILGLRRGFSSKSGWGKHR